MVSAVLAGYGEKLDAKPEIYQEFLRVLKASVDYAKHNPAEVYAAVAAATKVDEKFFERWFAEFSDFPVTLSGEDIKAIEILWAEAMKLGLLKSVPPVKETIWAKVLTQ